MRTGGCHCGAVRYEAEGEPAHHALCHCRDCRASSGAPAVGWIAFEEAQVTVVQGALSTYTGPTGSQRQFCTACGTGLFFRNHQFMPGIVDVQSVTLDSAAQEAPGAHIQVAEMLPWFDRLGELPRFERYPGA